MTASTNRNRTKEATLLQLDKQVLKAIREYCDETDWSMAGVIEEAIIEKLGLNHITPTRRNKVTLRVARDIFNSYVDGLTYKEIAEKHGVSPITVLRTLKKYRTRTS